jgi:hypothetical protein
MRSAGLPRQPAIRGGVAATSARHGEEEGMEQEPHLVHRLHRVVVPIVYSPLRLPRQSWRAAPCQRCRTTWSAASLRRLLTGTVRCAGEGAMAGPRAPPPPRAPPRALLLRGRLGELRRALLDRRGGGAGVRISHLKQEEAVLESRPGAGEVVSVDLQHLTRQLLRATSRSSSCSAAFVPPRHPSVRCRGRETTATEGIGKGGTTAAAILGGSLGSVGEERCGTAGVAEKHRSG